MITSLDQLDLDKRYTYADYLTWQFPERVELFRGKVDLVTPRPNTIHQTIAGNLLMQFYAEVKKHGWHFFFAPFDVRLPLPPDFEETWKVDTVVQPDICVICDEDKLDELGGYGAPDLIAEILLPGNIDREIKYKFELYESAGVKEYWLVYAQEEHIVKYTLNQEGRYTGSKPFITGEQVMSSALPGLVIEVSEIFN